MSDTPQLTQAKLLAVMDEIWREIGGLLDKFGDKLDTRMPIEGPSWTGRQFLGHILGSLQTTPYYLTQPRDSAPFETVIGDPYWRQINATATIHSFRAMMFAAHIGTVMLVESMSEDDLQRSSPSARGTDTTALDIVHFIYHVHLRTHVEDLRRWVQPEES